MMNKEFKDLAGAAEKFMRAADAVSGAHLRLARAGRGRDFVTATELLRKAELRYQYARKRLLNVIQNEESRVEQAERSPSPFRLPLSDESVKALLSEPSAKRGNR